MVLCNVNGYVGFGSQQAKVASDTMDVHATAPIQATLARQMLPSPSPGTGITGMPCLAASAMRRPPGSLMQGMPASETTATLAPPKSCSRTYTYPQIISMSHFRVEPQVFPSQPPRLTWSSLRRSLCWCRLSKGQRMSRALQSRDVCRVSSQ